MFEKLPTELLLQIIDRLDSRNAYISLARSSRGLYHRLIPSLYESIETPCYCADLHKGLVHTLLRHPELAQSVRHIRMGRLKYRVHPDHYRFHKHEHFACPISTKRLSQAAKEVSHREWEYTQWLEDLESGEHRDPWLAILLYICPNIETLEIFWGGRGTRYSEWLLKRAIQRSTPFDKKPAFPLLHCVTIKVLEDEGMDFHLPRLRPFFQLQTLRTFKGQYICDRNVEYGLLPINTSPITHLELQQCHSATGFIDLIAPCQNLKTFIYTQQEESSSDAGYGDTFGNLLPTQFTKSLATKKETLESITVDYYRRGRCFGDDYSEDWIGSFSDFNNLRHLRLRATNFIGAGDRFYSDVSGPRQSLVEFLPTSIETVWFSVGRWSRRFVDEIILREVLELLDAKEGFPYLTTINIEGEKWARKELKDELKKDVTPLKEIYPDYLGLLLEEKVTPWEPLRMRCLEVGVKFHLRDLKIERLLEEFDDPFMFFTDYYYEQDSENVHAVQEEEEHDLGDTGDEVEPDGYSEAGVATTA